MFENPSPFKESVLRLRNVKKPLSTMGRGVGVRGKH
jgi:hypothetical protein